MLWGCPWRPRSDFAFQPLTPPILGPCEGPRPQWWTGNKGHFITIYHMMTQWDQGRPRCSPSPTVNMRCWFLQHTLGAAQIVGSAGVIGGHICSSGRCQTMVSHHGEDSGCRKEEIGCTDAGGEDAGELWPHGGGHGSPSMSPEMQLGALTLTGCGHGLGTGGGKQLACQGCRVTGTSLERTWEFLQDAQSLSETASCGSWVWKRVESQSCRQDSFRNWGHSWQGLWLKQSFGAQVHSKSMTIVFGAPSAQGTC